MSMACVKSENTVWGEGLVNRQKVREMSGNFTLPGEWSPWFKVLLRITAIYFSAVCSNKILLLCSPYSKSKAAIPSVSLG